MFYYGFLDGKIITEATVLTDPDAVQNSEGLVDAHMTYLSAFRTDLHYRKQGHFTSLFQYMLNDLQK